MIQIFYIPDGFDASAELECLLPRLPQWRLQKVRSYRRDIDRFLCAKAFLMLEEMLRKEFGLPGCPEFSYDIHGKPFFLNYPEIFFNISHCHRGIACALMDKSVGIDIEEIQFNEDLAKVILDNSEYASVINAEEPDVEFTKFWTRKESFLKLTGEGLRDNMKNVLFCTNKAIFTTETNLSAGYVYSTAIWEYR